MYNRILNRPMFKLGGKTNDAQGTGITSGLDAPRQGYDDGDRVKTFREQLSGIDVSVPESTRKRAFWSGIGQGFGSNPRTLGEALRGSVVGRDQILGPAEALAAERKFQLEQTGVTGEFEYGIQELKNAGALNVAEVANAFENTVTGGSIKRIEEMDITESQKATMIRSVILKSKTPELIANYAIAIMKLAAANMDTTMTPEIAEQKASIIIMNIIAASGLPIKSKGEAKGGLIYNKGGRAGYQFGTTNQGVQPVQASLNVDETIQTPQGTVQEDVSIQGGPKPTVQMPYQEFRAAIPAEVSDEIVQLIYYNEDAFADFSQITSQAEVYAFNNKYGVSLVLPMDTETT
jgi:hypothetical protein